METVVLSDIRQLNERGAKSLEARSEICDSPSQTPFVMPEGMSSEKSSLFTTIFPQIDNRPGSIQRNRVRLLDRI